MLLERIDDNGIDAKNSKAKPSAATEPPVLKRILDLGRKLFNMEDIDQ
jgi:hypothetical protein